MDAACHAGEEAAQSRICQTGPKAQVSFIQRGQFGCHKPANGFFAPPR